ncbi:MAG: hypothetical protein PHT95_07385 [Candidatus Omnitrophica bacterium]|nr:hypothetical protein [Candidatus Omnitrophota bacterium]
MPKKYGTREVIEKYKQQNKEMLDALKNVAELFHEDEGEWIESIRALIEKVEGKGEQHDPINAGRGGRR